MFRCVMKGAVVGVALMMALGVRPALAADEEEPAQPTVSGKKQAYMGDPSIHRGQELGFDRGYLAAKTDQNEGLSPDLGRHNLYNDPKPMYRYEFGNRGMFYHGFRSGFWVGYRQGWENTEVTYVAPRKSKSEDSEAPNGVMGMEAEEMGPGGAMSSGGQKHTSPKKAEAKAQVLSDAL